MVFRVVVARGVEDFFCLPLSSFMFLVRGADGKEGYFARRAELSWVEFCTFWGGFEGWWRVCFE